MLNFSHCHTKVSKVHNTIFLTKVFKNLFDLFVSDLWDNHQVPFAVDAYSIAEDQWDLQGVLVPVLKLSFGK
jgi:hypothetical protein